MTSDFLKNYWAYKRDGGQMSMKAYSDMVKDNLSHEVEGPVVKKPFKKGALGEGGF